MRHDTLLWRMYQRWNGFWLGLKVKRINQREMSLLSHGTVRDIQSYADALKNAGAEANFEGFIRKGELLTSEAENIVLRRKRSWRKKR